MTDLYASEIYRKSISEIQFVTQQEVNNLATALERKSDIKFAKINLDGLKSEIVNTPDELEEYYQNNQFLFFSDEQRNFQYIEIKQDEYINKVEIPVGYLESEYQQYLQNSENNAQIRFAHIMIDKNNYDSNQLALESIKNVEGLLQQGSNFSDLAKEYSEDFVTKDIGGDLEYFEEGIFPVEFEDEIKELELNQISKIVELEDTLHILKITEKNIEEPLPKDDVISNIKNELLETESFALMKDDYDQIDQLVLETQEKMNKVYKELTASIK